MTQLRSLAAATAVIGHGLATLLAGPLVRLLQAYDEAHDLDDGPDNDPDHQTPNHTNQEPA